MLRLSRHVPALAVASLGAVLFSAPASALMKVGVLSCHVEGGTGLVVYSKKALRCTFRDVSGRVEGYSGSISRFGLDLGRTTGASLIWNVFAPGSTRPGALAGSYVGAGAEATLGAGPGANALVGGFARSITLQPVSLQAQTGVNLAAGVAAMTLRAR